MAGWPLFLHTWFVRHGLCQHVFLNTQVDDWSQHLKGSQRTMQEMVGSINNGGSSEDAGDWDTSSAAEIEAADAISQEQGQPKPEDVKFVVSAELGELALHVSGHPPEVWQVPQVRVPPLSRQITCLEQLQACPSTQAEGPY